MGEMTARLADDGLRHRYEAAHRDYLARRELAATAAGVEPLPPGTQSAGGMPERVKCLHALVAHELAAVGVNPFGAEALEAAGAWWRSGPCGDEPCVDKPRVDEPGLDAQRVDEHCVREDVP